MSTKPIQIADHWLDQGTMAAALGLSLSGFQKWNVKPVARIGRRVYYEAGDVLANRLEHQRRLLERRAEAGTVSENEREQRIAKLALMKAQAEGQELKNAQLREQLAPVELLRWVLEKVAGELCRHLDAIPEAARKSMPKLRPADLAILKREVGKAQRLAVDMPALMSEFLESPPAD